jgi:CheY-like chemotaxis protein
MSGGREPSNGIRLADRRVLVIEDESMVAMLIEDMLEEIGCKLVGSASRFDDALEKARSLSFDVAILDINLHGQQTLPIAETLADRNSAFIFATGYGAISMPETLRKVPILAKPFQQRDLERALRAALQPARDRDSDRHTRRSRNGKVRRA